MKQADFEARFDAYWQEHYASYDETGKDLQTLVRDWKERAQDHSRRTHLRLTLLRYARDVRVCELSRKRKNLAQRIFDELGVRPEEIEFDRHTADLLGIGSQAP
jgi:hypothetical protein